MSKPPQRHGFTMVEMMVTVAVIAVLLLVAAPSLADMLSRYRVELAANELKTNIALARTEVGLRARTVALEFKQGNEGSCYTMSVIGTVSGRCDCTKGAGSACRGQQPELKTVTLARGSGVTLSPSATWPDSYSVNYLRLDPPRITADPADFAVLIKGSRAGQLLIKLNPLGRISTCTPDRSMPGYEPC